MTAFNKNNPFKTPEGYFEGFNHRLMDTHSEGNLSLPKKEGFVVPDGYFKSVNDTIISKLDVVETKVVQLHPLRKYYYAAASIAAVLLVIFGLNLPASEAVTFDSLAESDIENYFENNDYDLSAFEIAEVIPVDELEINDILTNQFEEENLIEYLDENTNTYEELNLEDYE